MFVAADVTNIDAARQNAKRERAWQSILNDPDLRENLTRAQTSDAEAQARRSQEALLRSIRGAWVHVLHPAAPDGGDNVSGAERGFAVRSTRLINRAGAKSIPAVVWDKVERDGTVIAAMGPHNLARSLDPVWPADQPHIPIDKIRDWFASYVYMPRLRDEATLDQGLQMLVKDLAEPYVFASAFDEDTGTYAGAIEGIVRVTDDLRSGLLVRRNAVPPPETEETEPDDAEETEPGRNRGGANRDAAGPVLRQHPGRAGAGRTRGCPDHGCPPRGTHPLNGLERPGDPGRSRELRRSTAIRKMWSIP